MTFSWLESLRSSLTTFETGNVRGMSIPLDEQLVQHLNTSFVMILEEAFCFMRQHYDSWIFFCILRSPFVSLSGALCLTANVLRNGFEWRMLNVCLIMFSLFPVTCCLCQGLADTGPAKHSGEASEPEIPEIPEIPMQNAFSKAKCFTIACAACANLGLFCCFYYAMHAML